MVGGSREGSHFGKKENDDSVYSHFYTRAQLKEIAEYCKERYIEVIPENRYSRPRKRHTSGVSRAIVQ